MEAYQIEYFCHTQYEFPVAEAVFELNVLPCQNKQQNTFQSRFKSTFKENGFLVKNAFGFDIQRFRTAGSFQEVEFRLHALVHRDISLPALYSDRTVEEEWNSLALDQTYFDHHLFMEQSSLTQSTIEIPKAIAQMVKNEKVLDVLMELNRWVKEVIAYEKAVTHVGSTAQEAYDLKAGVCQDYSHVFLSIARKMGIPSRYVSGYLNQGLPRVGNAFMHAWVECWIPGLDWIGFDPTNNLFADGHYLKVCHGTDYTDCAPIKGVLRTNGKQESAYTVSVHRL
jgi:hypothetical protein